MNCLSERFRRTAPVRGGSRNDLVPSTPPRRNGWSGPPQAQQVVGWLVYIYFAIVSFGIYVPLLPQPWNHVAYALMGVAFIVHFFSHIVAVSIDPADDSVRAKNNYNRPVPLFDRTTQLHVIHNLHCYLCDVNVGPKVKHCGSCNKCVENFDHHCKWLNNCVGGRNYRSFFLAMSSAAVGITLLIAIVLFVFIQHFLNPSSLRMAPQFNSILGNTTWLVFLPLAPVNTSSSGLLALALITIVLSVTCLLLLGHLLIFHLYLLCKGISTHEYLKRLRKKEARNRNEAGNPPDAKAHCSTSAEGNGSVDCELALPQSSSSCKFNGSWPFNRKLSGSLCTEMEDFSKSSEMENGFQVGRENPTHKAAKGDSSMKDLQLWEPDSNNEAQSPHVKSPDCVPEVQDPLGSAVMTPQDC